LALARAEEPTKAWVGNENPCSEEDMYLFYVATEVTIGNTLQEWRKTPTAWLGCQRMGGQTSLPKGPSA
jgi:hypothetical protein